MGHIMSGSTSSTEAFQISSEQAEIYESKFVPALFAQWAAAVLDAAGVRAEHSVLDVACGTGILARTAVERVGTTGRVAGVDLNEGMLTVARRLGPGVEWRQADVAELPFAPDTFDAVLCQSALMFFPDATGALREMARVCMRGGAVGVQVYDNLDAQPTYEPLVSMVGRLAGPEATNLLQTYWVHGDLDILRGRFEAAGLEIASTRTEVGTLRWGSIDEFVQVEVESTPLIARIDADVYRRIREESRELLRRFQTPTGFEAPVRAHIVIGRKP
jgi:SAM-dependent methyltransferase